MYMLKRQENGDFNFIPTNEIYDQLKPAVYRMMAEPITGQKYLEIVKDNFNVEDVYGKENIERADFIISQYKRYGKLSTMFTGYKGSGKTFIMNLIASRLLDEGIPVINVEPGDGPEIIDYFMQNIDRVCFRFDEFEKILNPLISPGLLSVIDSNNYENHLLLFTSNTLDSVDKYFVGRPGRIRYIYKYSKLSPEVITDYCNDKLEIEDIDRIISSLILIEPSMDQVVEIVRDLNAGISFEDCLFNFNIDIKLRPVAIRLQSGEIENNLSTETELPPWFIDLINRGPLSYRIGNIKFKTEEKTKDFSSMIKSITSLAAMSKENIVGMPMKEVNNVIYVGCNTVNNNVVEHEFCLSDRATVENGRIINDDGLRLYVKVTGPEDKKIKSSGPKIVHTMEVIE